MGVRCHMSHRKTTKATKGQGVHPHGSAELSVALCAAGLIGGDAVAVAQLHRLDLVADQPVERLNIVKGPAYMTVFF
jgi:hypothetical protein